MSELRKGSAKSERTPRLLVVDDDPGTAELIRQWFAGSMEVLDAPDGAEGLKAAVERGPDLLLLDLRMPGLDGIAVAQQLKEDTRTRAIPIVVIQNACHVVCSNSARTLSKARRIKGLSIESPQIDESSESACCCKRVSASVPPSAVCRFA